MPGCARHLPGRTIHSLEPGLAWSHAEKIGRFLRPHGISRANVINRLQTVQVQVQGVAASHVSWQPAHVWKRMMHQAVGHILQFFGTPETDSDHVSSSINSSGRECSCAFCGHTLALHSCSLQEQALCLRLGSVTNSTCRKPSAVLMHSGAICG